jgi:DNA-binding winged helix-turn-helix (wHTH) protein
MSKAQNMDAPEDDGRTATIRFAGCRLDPGARRLFRGAREVHLSPKAFELLTVLVESRPRAVSKAELLDRVWRGVFVSEASLARAINEIREALGDPAQGSRIVRTVHGHGYAFDAEVEDDAGHRIGAGGRRRAAICWLTSEEREFPLHDGDHVAGRHRAADIWLDSPRVSRRHARFAVTGSSAIVEDLGSKNGTFVRGERIAAAVPLKSGDEVRIGPFTFVFRLDSAAGSTQSEIRLPSPRP